MKSSFDAELSPAWAGWWASFLRNMRALNRSKFTIATYTESAEALARFSAARGLPLDPVALTRADLEAYIADELERNSESTARTRYIALRAFYRWLEEEGEVTRNPMTRMKSPKVGEQPVGVLSDDDVVALLKACSGRTFADRRDAAIIRLMLDSGGRRSEVAGMLLENIRLDDQMILVTSKGGDAEYVYFGAKCARDLDRYLRVRAKHPKASLPALWLAPKGGLTGSGLYQMLQDRAAQAGLAVHVRPHLFRHTFAHALKSAGASDEDTARLGRWKDINVMRKYGRALSARRAQETHRRLSPGDRL